MITRKAPEPIGIGKGLQRAVAYAPHPTMKRLGELALKRGFSQERLAKALNERFGSKLNGANVYAHITAQRPQRETIERYAELLGLNHEQLHIIEHGTIPADRERHWEAEVLRLLPMLPADFKPGAVKAVKQALRDPKVRARALTGVAMLWNEPVRPSRWLPRAVQLPAFDVLAEMLYPSLDMRDYLRERSPGDDALYVIYIAANSLYRDDAKALAFVDACAAILRLDGFDSEPMHEFLRDILRGQTIFAKSLHKKGHRS